MKILIIGGTRFLGKLVVFELKKLGHDLTVISRRKLGCNPDIRCINGERSEVLDNLNGEAFDLVLDFICYSADALDDIKRNIKAANYVLISSTWVPKLWSGISATELVYNSISQSSPLPAVTFEYLNGKLSAEQGLVTLKSCVDNTAALRLPIILGNEDHTGRTDFYLTRLVDGGPIILVDGGENIAQVAALESLASTIAVWSTSTDLSKSIIWEGLPHDRRSVRGIILDMAKSIGIEPRFVSVEGDVLREKLPKYLGKEPLWRELPMSITEANIFNAIKIPSVPFGVSTRDTKRSEILYDPERALEINFVKDFSYA